MREILFRGKTKRKEWIYGDLITHGIDFDDAIKQHHTREVWDIIPETVGQFTGLTDKNGNKIFEGDVVKVQFWEEENGNEYIVKFVEDRGGWFPFASGDGCGCCEEATITPNDKGIVSVKVIGNIHDNPELLGGVK